MSWQVTSFMVLTIVLVAGFAWYERSRPPSRVLALVAALAALAVVGRVAFAAIPNVQATTDIVLLAGFALGGAPGFCVGAVTALVSNVFLAQGPWTPWQMVAWGGVGVAGATLAWLVRGRDLGRLPLALACGFAGLAFGAFMDVYQWTLGAEQTPAAYLAVSATSLPFNVAHAVGNFLFCLLVGPALVTALRRYRRRLEVRWPVPAVGTASAARIVPVIAAALVVASLALPAAVEAAGSGDAVRYLAKAQNRDGGFGSAAGESSNQLMTGWAALGLAAADRNPRDVRAGGDSVTDYIRGGSRGLTKTGDISRTVLALEASGASPRSFAGRDLVAELQARRRGDGSYPDGRSGQGLVNQTAFAILALRAAGASPGSESADWLARQQNGGGGFGFAGGISTTDVTGAVLQALAAAGNRGGRTVNEAVGYLRQKQNGDGGFGQMDESSNTQSTAWAVQGVLAVGGGGSVAGGGIRYIRGQQASDGSIRYASGNGQDPVWVTGQALLALERQPFPVAAAPRAPGGSGGGRGGRAGASGAGATGGGGGGAADGGGSGAAAGAGSAGGDGARGDRSDGARDGGARGRRDGEVGSLIESRPEAAGDSPLAAEEAAAPGGDGGSALAAVIAALVAATVVAGCRRLVRRRAARAGAAAALGPEPGAPAAGTGGDVPAPAAATSTTPAPSPSAASPAAPPPA